MSWRRQTYSRKFPGFSLGIAHALALVTNAPEDTMIQVTHKFSSNKVTETYTTLTEALSDVESLISDTPDYLAPVSYTVVDGQGRLYAKYEQVRGTWCRTC